MSLNSARQEVKEQNPSYSWLESFISYVKERRYKEAKKLLYENKSWWEEDFVRRAEICSKIYDIMQNFIYRREFSEARIFASAFPELGIENWLPKNLRDKPYKA